jgi:tRNA A-37 threonylcarbamoyl transferase component Bud32
MSGATLTLPIARDEPKAPTRRDGFVPTEIGGVGWIMREDLIDALLPAIGRVDQIQAAAGVETVKTGPHRTVYRLILDGGVFYLKHFRAADLRALLQNLIRPSKAAREFEAARRVAQLGLPTFEPVALGRVKRGGIVRDSFLISREIPAARPLDRFVLDELATTTKSLTPRAARSWQSEVRQKLAVSMGELAARLHQAAVDHADFHAANVLIHVGVDRSPELWLIDLHRVRFRRALTWQQRFENLARLHQFFAGKSSRTDRLRFYRAYGRSWRLQAAVSTGSRDTDEYSEIADLESTLSAGAVLGWVRADRAWRRGNRHVRKLDCAAARCRGLATLDSQWLRTVRDDPERLFRENSRRWHKQSAKHRVAEIRLPLESAAPINAGQSAFLKCIEQPAGWRRWLNLFRDSAVRRCWELGHALLRRGIDTPRPLLFVERRGAPSRLYLMTETIPNSLSVAEFMNDVWPAMSPDERRGWVASHARQLARQVRRLHEAGFDHRDLKFANLLVADERADPRIWLLDLDGVRVWRSVPRRRAVQNLARINVSALVVDMASCADRLRFLKNYLGDKFHSEWKWWWQSIARTSIEKIKKNRRGGRALS